MNDAQIKAYYEPFEKISGIKVRAFPGSNPTKVKAMVETGNVEWDMAQLSRGSIMNLQKSGDYFEKIDYDIIDPGVDPAYRFEYGLEMLVWAQVLAYRTDQTKGAVPKGWADFWDTKKFPGDRAMIGTSAGGWPELEFALMAAGVPADKLYPLDIDKGFASYDKIKKDIVKWWDTGAMPIQLLTDREVTMTTVWNGRMEALQAAGVPAAISWSQGLLKRDAWGIPKGAKNKVNAMKFAAYSTMAIPQARIALRHPLRLGQQRVERVHPARAAGGAAERARHQVAARQLQLRLVDRQPRGGGQPLQQMAAELSAMNGVRPRRLGVADRPRETLRPHQRGRRRLARHPLGRVPDPAGAQRLGQDHDPDDDRGLRDADRGRHRHRRASRWSPCRPTAATSAWCSRTTRCSRT